jgi:large subunit ribosomal protein L25
MEITKLSAASRSEKGKGPARRLRIEGKIPAVAYGKKLEATQLAVSPKELRAVLATSHGKNSVVELVVEGKSAITAMVREYAHHPVSREIIHADFIQVDLNEPVDVNVPLKMTGKAKGIITGGIVQQVFRQLPVRCLPNKIPVLVEMDVTELDMGDSLKVSQLTLPEGVTVRLSPEQTLVSVVAPEKKSEAEEAADAAKAAAKAAPAAGAAAPAAAAAPAKAADKKKK